MAVVVANHFNVLADEDEELHTAATLSPVAGKKKRQQQAVSGKKQETKPADASMMRAKPIVGQNRSVTRETVNPRRPNEKNKLNFNAMQNVDEKKFSLKEYEKELLAKTSAFKPKSEKEEAKVNKLVDVSRFFTAANGRRRRFLGQELGTDQVADQQGYVTKADPVFNIDDHLQFPSLK